LANGSSREAQNFVRARFQQDLAEALSCCDGIRRRAARITADKFTAVGGKNGGFDVNFVCDEMRRRA
jgi:hypothetical protein